MKGAKRSELTFSWELPALLGDEVVDYHVEVKGLHHRGGREVIQIAVVAFNTNKKTAVIRKGLGNNNIIININVFAKSMNDYFL